VRVRVVVYEEKTDTGYSVSDKVYEQVVRELDLQALIFHINKLEQSIQN